MLQGLLHWSSRALPCPYQIFLVHGTRLVLRGRSSWLLKTYWEIVKVDRRSTLGCHCRPRATCPASTRSNRGPRTERTALGKKKGVLCEIRALLMVIGPPYDCWVTFNDRADLIVSYCIRRPTTPTGTFEARVFQTIPIFFLFHCFFSLPKNALSLKIMLEMFPWIGSRGILSWGDINVVEICLAIFFYSLFFGRGLSWKFIRGIH